MDKNGLIDLFGKEIKEECSICGKIKYAQWKECGCDDEGFNRGIQRCIEIVLSYSEKSIKK